MKKVVVLGAGRVARPCVQYLLENGYEVYAADISAICIIVSVFIDIALTSLLSILRISYIDY